MKKLIISCYKHGKINADFAETRDENFEELPSIPICYICAEKEAYRTRCELNFRNIYKYEKSKIRKIEMEITPTFN